MNKPTLTIGIPAYNEAENIKNMILSLLKQKEGFFVLEEILVVLDCSTDSTFEIVDSLASKNKKIKIINGKERLGKSARLNQIYKFNKSDLVATFDADIILDRNIELNEMIGEFRKNTNVVTGFQVPVKSNSIIGSLSNVAFEMWYGLTSNINNGNNLSNVQGACSILTKKFSKSFTYPKGLICDQGYLYMIATKNNPDGLRIAKGSRILFKMPSTLHDSRILASRSMYKDKEQMQKYFGKQVLEKYKINRYLKFTAVLKSLKKHPFLTLPAIIFQYYLRIFKLNDKMFKNGTWSKLYSTKNVKFSALNIFFAHYFSI